MRYEIDKNGCWNFTGPFGHFGYGKLKLKDMTFTAHRVMAHLTLKAIMSETDIVAHKCDNPKCINPEHLFITTYAGNSADMVSKKRSAKGEKHGNSKLTERMVKNIREQYQSGKTLSQIAPQFSVTDGCIQAIVKRRTWRHLP
jgi:hypothetical protein